MGKSETKQAWEKYWKVFCKDYQYNNTFRPFPNQFVYWMELAFRAGVKFGKKINQNDK